jgi:c(7)-type cytochrome triheme protein
MSTTRNSSIPVKDMPRLVVTLVISAPTIPRRHAFLDTAHVHHVIWASSLRPAIPMCLICHTETSGNKPPLRSFPTSFKESFNVKFDHQQHMTGSAKPEAGCNGCHAGLVNRGFGLSIPANLAAHTTCYTCHKPDSKSAAGREIASCAVCHGQGAYTPTTTNSRVYRFSFSHAKHGTREKLNCTDCHKLNAGLPQTRQVSSPTAFQHFPTGRGSNCATCHNGKQTFGGDLGFNSCRRCHTGPTFRMPM